MDLLNNAITSFEPTAQEENETWVYYSIGKKLKKQGWKIHISSQMTDALIIFEKVSKLLLQEKCNFKVAKNSTVLAEINSPRNDTSTANKFITIYPNNCKEARHLIIKLNDLLKDYQGPQIMSDFQLGINSPIHYRYGGFQARRVFNQEKNKIIHMIEDDKGNLVEDVRGSTPYTPNWVVPLFSEEEKDYYFSNKKETIYNSKLQNYHFISILKKTNRGNVYRAVKKDTEQPVIIKQARPFVGNSNDEKWMAINELKNEKMMLQEFLDKSYTANYVDDFYLEGNYFLVQTEISGKNFFEIALRNGVSTKQKEQYIQNIVQIINELHREGYLLVDLSPTNFIYKENGQVSLIDLENISNEKAPVRRVQTPGMLNQDTDLSIANIQQDYFALGMVAIAILIGHVLPVSKGDGKLNLSSMQKVMLVIDLAVESDDLTPYQSSWIKIVLKMSESTQTSQNIPMLLEDRSESLPSTLSNHSFSYDFHKEIIEITNDLLNRTVDKHGRIAKSSEFGEFISPLSIQHGLAGYIVMINKFYHGRSEKIKNLITQVNEVNNLLAPFEYENSLLFGRSGYLWSLITTFETSTDPDYLFFCEQIVQNLMEQYKNEKCVDFALGKAGILLSLMKYSSVIEDVQVDLFIKENIEEIFNSFSTISVNNLMEYAFAHGKAGLAYVLNCYSRIYKDDIYDDAINSFSDFIADVIRKQLLTGFDKLKSLDYSWCEGFSGLILYLCLVKQEKYQLLLIKAQNELFKQHLNMGTSYCHGLASLLQTIAYTENKELYNKIVIILLTRSYRDSNVYLVFQSECPSQSVFDFGTGTFGIYWTILKEKFLFSLDRKSKR